MKKKKKNFDAVGWKAYCSKLYCGAGRWQALGARGWADYAQQALGEHECWACQVRAAGRRERAWRAGRAGARRAAGARALAGALARASGSWEQAQAGKRQLGARRASGSWARGRVLGVRQGAGRAAGRRWARGARAVWAPELALGSALGALGPFSIRFDSFFFPESPNEHRSL